MGFKSRKERIEVIGWGCSQAGKASTAKRKELLESLNPELNQLCQNAIIRGKGFFAPAAPETLIFEREYIFGRIIEREMPLADADKIISHAHFSLRQQNGKLHTYYSSDGFVAVRADGGDGKVWILKFPKMQYFGNGTALSISVKLMRRFAMKSPTLAAT